MDRARRIDLVACAGVVLLGLLAYSTSFHGAFVFDDVRQVRDNALLSDLGAWVTRLDGYRSLPTRYVAYLTFALNRSLGGPAPVGFHVVNVAIHLANALLVYALARTAFRTPLVRESRLAGAAPAVAFASAAVFVTHPLQTQAVTYVVQRVTSLAAFFYLGAVVLYLSSRLAGRGAASRGIRYGLALVAALLAMRTKEIAFTLPFALAFLEWGLFGRPTARRWLLLAPFLAVALVVPLSLVRLGQPAAQVLSEASDATRVQWTASRLDYLRTQVAVVATYLRLLALPAGQNVDHDFLILRSFLAPRVLGGLAVHLSLLALAAWAWLRSAPGARRRLDPAWRLVSLGILLFFLALSVESSVIPIVDVLFEHRVYLPSAFLLVAAATAAGLLLSRVAGAEAAPWLAAGASILALVLAGATLARNQVWASDVSLWSDAVEKSPDKARPWMNLGTALAESGRMEDALVPLRRAAALGPQPAPALTQAGAILILLGRPAEAEPLLLEALRASPGDPTATFNLGEALWRSGRRSEAVAHFRSYLAAPETGTDPRLRRVAAARVRAAGNP
jgi:tetratricopeptide (TPR) repeat protein